MSQRTDAEKQENFKREKPDENEEIRNKYLEKVKKFDLEKLQKKWREARLKHLETIRKSNCTSNDNNNSISQDKTETIEEQFYEQQEENDRKRFLNPRDEYFKSLKARAEKKETLQKSNEQHSQLNFHNEILKLPTKAIKIKDNLKETQQIPSEQNSQLKLLKRHEEYVANQDIEKLRARWRVARPENVERIKKSKSASNDNNNSILQYKTKIKKEYESQKQEENTVKKRLILLRDEYVKSLLATAEKGKKQKKSKKRNSQLNLNDEFLKLSAKTLKGLDSSQEALIIAREQNSQLKLRKRKKEFVLNEPIEEVQARLREAKLKNLESIFKSNTESNDNNNFILQDKTETKDDEFEVQQKVDELKRLLNRREEYLKSLKASAEKKETLEKSNKRNSQLNLDNEFLKLSTKTIKRKDNLKETLQIPSEQNTQLELIKRHKECIKKEHTEKRQLRWREAKLKHFKSIRESKSASKDNNNSILQVKTETQEDEIEEKQNVNNSKGLLNLFEEYLKAVEETAEKEETLKKLNKRSCQLNLHNELYKCSAITITGKDNLEEMLQIRSERNSQLDLLEWNKEYVGNETIEKLQVRWREAKLKNLERIRESKSAGNDNNNFILQDETETKEDDFEEQQEMSEEKRKLNLRDKYLRAIKARAEKEDTLNKSNNTTENDNLEAKLRLLSKQYCQVDQRLRYLKFQLDNKTEKNNDKEKLQNELISELLLHNECLQLVNDFVGKEIGNIEEYIIENNKPSTHP